MMTARSLDPCLKPYKDIRNGILKHTHRIKLFRFWWHRVKGKKKQFLALTEHVHSIRWGKPKLDRGLDAGFIRKKYSGIFCQKPESPLPS